MKCHEIPWWKLKETIINGLVQGKIEAGNHRFSMIFQWNMVFSMVFPFKFSVQPIHCLRHFPSIDLSGRSCQAELDQAEDHGSWFFEPDDLQVVSPWFLQIFYLYPFISILSYVIFYFISGFEVCLVHLVQTVHLFPWLTTMVLPEPMPIMINRELWNDPPTSPGEDANFDASPELQRFGAGWPRVHLLDGEMSPGGWVSWGKSHVNPIILTWLVVWNIFYVPIYWE